VGAEGRGSAVLCTVTLALAVVAAVLGYVGLQL